VTLGDRYHGVARDADERGIAAVGGNVQQHLHIRERRGIFQVFAAAQFTGALRGTVVRAEHQDVDRHLPEGIGCCASPLGVAQVLLRRLDVAVEVLVVEPSGESRQEDADPGAHGYRFQIALDSRL
jgi:hypothetical protein